MKKTDELGFIKSHFETIRSTEEILAEECACKIKDYIENLNGIPSRNEMIPIINELLEFDGRFIKGVLFKLEGITTKEEFKIIQSLLIQYIN